MSIGPIEILIILVFGVLLIASISWIIGRTKKRAASHSERLQATCQSASSPPPLGPTTQPRPASPFTKVERQVDVLRQQVSDGLLTEEECKARMRNLMVEDADGNWWMVGYETGEWYRHDGTDWMRADPPLARTDERSAGGAR